MKARKVGSFPRALIGVMDLIDAVCSVRFSSTGVHAITRTVGGCVESKIGEPTESWLFSFDLPGLIDHIREVTAVASVGVR